ncbi:type VII secretion-associated serine protease mycosin [Kitasatospora sp. NPDC048239]|uniref:type VII secretion-associated serine protease mycosin n=1 Tax=Kitasatospora sp. NPDC048239 TaxID=3364046 RepID=UPI00371EF7A9
MDSIREQQWHLDAMKAPEMWQTTKGQGATVAVIDSGFKMDHPDLSGQFLPGKDFSGLPGGVGVDATGHGTGIAGFIAGTGKGLGGKGAYGLAPGAKILPLKINTNGDAANPIDASGYLKQVDQAIVYAADQGAKVINISSVAGSTGVSPTDISELGSAVTHATAKGALVVAGAGNSGQQGNPLLYPAALSGVMAVAAVDRNGLVTSESEHGPQVDLAAPGMEMYTSCTGASGYCKTHGTSDATAIVSASAALLSAAHPDWNGNQIARVLINTAGKPTDGSSWNDSVGYGGVRPRVALTTPGDPGPANANPLAEAPPGTQPSPGPATTAAPSVSASAPATVPASPVPSEGGEPVGSPVAQPRADEGSDSGSLVPMVAAVVVGLVLVAGVVFFVLRRRAASREVPVGEPAGVVPPAPSGYPNVPGQAPQQSGPGVPPPPGYGPPSYEPPAPPSDNPYAR